MGFMDMLLGGTPEVNLPPAIKAEIEELQYIPFGPERDALIDRITQTYGISADLFDSELGSLGQYLQRSEDALQGSMDQLQGISNRFQGFAGADPYMEFYGNPAAREQSYMKALQEANAAAFDPYGSVGSESEQRQGLMAADAARRGIVNSGVARRQQEQEQQRYAALRAEADAKAIQAARQQGLGEANAFNQAKQLASSNLGQAAGVQQNIAEIANRIPQNRMAAAQLYGNTAMDTGGVLGAAQSEDRAARQSVENYNTEVANKVNQDFAAASNQRNASQASLDASRRRPGLLTDVIMPMAGTALSAAGSFMGGRAGGRGMGSALGGALGRGGSSGGSALAGLGSIAGNVLGGAMQGASGGSQSNWNPQIPSADLNSRFTRRAPSSNNWGSYLGGGF